MGKSEFADGIKAFIKSAGAKKCLLYLAFVAVSSIFWLFNTANKISVHDVELPFQIENIPDSVMFISDPPRKINVSIRETGINALFKKKSKITIRFSDYDMGSGVFKINLMQLSAIVREKYSRESMINSILPDSISLR